MGSALIGILVGTMFGVLGATMSKSMLYQAPDECRWVGATDDDVTLVCKLRTINSELENTNFSVIQPQNTVRLRLECSDGLFFQSSINPGSFRALVELRSLSVEYCKLSNLTDGSFRGLSALRNLTIRTHNADWSAMSLDVGRGVFTEELEALQGLDLSDNNMWTIPDGMICPLRSLQRLNLTRNRIRDLGPFHLSASISTVSSKKCGSAMQMLDLSHNNIENLPAAIFSGLGRLSELRLAANGMNFIADRALEGLISLAIVDLSENRLSNLPPELFSEAKNVQEIYLQNNSLNVLAPGIFSELTQVVVLDLSHNELTSEWINGVTFRGMRRLVMLDVSSNRISRLEVTTFRDLTSLQILRLQENQIEVIPDGIFADLGNLHTLVLSNNRLSTVEVTTFQGLNTLSLLSLDYNRIARIDREALKNCSGSLQDLHLNGNKLHRVPDVLYDVLQLKTLDLGENQITNIDEASFSGMVQMFGLRLTENSIETIKRGTFDRMEALQILNLSHNKIRKIDHEAFNKNTNLQAIRLDGNHLTDITGLFTKLPNLVWLNISDNRLEVFDYALIPTGLQWLDIHANKISELGNYFEMENQLSLSTFDASSNKLIDITGSAIPNSIEVLYLSDNLISKVQSYTFFKKPNLTRVDLFGNKITTLDPNALRISAVPEDRQLPEFFIGGNPFECDCNLDWLQKSNTVDSRTQPKLMDVASIYCKLNYNRGNMYMPLVEAEASQFLCKYETHCFALCHCCDFNACDCKMECPNRCSCFHDQSWTSNVVDCSRAGYENRLPDLIPMDATQIHLDGNDLQEVSSHAFIGRKKLRILFLNSSNINTLHNRTFNGLRELEVLQLDNNRLTELKGFEFTGLQNLRELYLHNNLIAAIDNDTFSHLTEMRILRLDNNRLTTFYFVHLPQALTEVHLAGNMWSCECDFVEKIKDFMSKSDVVRDKLRVKCSHTVSENDVAYPSVKFRSRRGTVIDRSVDDDPHGFFVLAENSSRICTGVMEAGNHSNLTSTKTILSQPPLNDYIPLLVATLCGFVVIIVAILVIFMFRQEMRVWFHSRFGVRLFYRASDTDKNERDKLYDAFVSYSSKDEAFVAEDLAPALENGDPSYKLCLHYRDFPVGPYSPDTIVQAVESSRRTIMVLSENFIKSEWCRFEFKSAHHQVLRDRRRRLIVILLGEVPQKDLDPDIRLYLKTNTYLQWGDKLFWEKLRFALPDVPNNQRRQTPQNRHQNTSIAIQTPVQHFRNHNVTRHNNRNQQMMMSQPLQPMLPSAPMDQGSGLPNGARTVAIHI
ncbi:toll-like receptor Tollo [Phlebotomus argentipes]|uniref:toll-like receptor Tollo n=1 Tax=Phlebotomus argentipes TaxID=94469 RepID=UPI002892B770|nr:toll-like receptor Tollo [Phlebotomus argentipes]